MKLLKELEQLINKHSQENGSNTPDFILASFINKCLRAFDETVNDRERWYGRPTSEFEKEQLPTCPGVNECRASDVQKGEEVELFATLKHECLAACDKHKDGHYGNKTWEIEQRHERIIMGEIEAAFERFDRSTKSERK